MKILDHSYIFPENFSSISHNISHVFISDETLIENLESNFAGTVCVNMLYINCEFILIRQKHCSYVQVEAILISNWPDFS
jgi:hypothetical protein